MMKIILDSLTTIKKLNFGVIINKIPKNGKKQIQENFGNFEKMLSHNFSSNFLFEKKNVFIFGKERKVDDQNGYLVPLKNEFKDFVFNFEGCFIDGDEVKELDFKVKKRKKQIRKTDQRKEERPDKQKKQRDEENKKNENEK